MRPTTAPRHPAAWFLVGLVALVALLLLADVRPAAGEPGDGEDGTTTTTEQTTTTTEAPTTTTTERPRPTTTTTEAPTTTTTEQRRDDDRCGRRHRRCRGWPPYPTPPTTAPAPVTSGRRAQAEPTTSTTGRSTTTAAPSTTTTLAIPPLPTTIGHGDRSPKTSLAAASVEDGGTGHGSRNLTTVAWVVAVGLGIGVFGFVLRLDKRLTRR
jgi:hypothetical protein